MILDVVLGTMMIAASAEEPKSTDWLQANMATVMAVFAAVQIGQAVLIYFETKNGPIRAVKVAAAAASVDALRREQTNLLTGMMRHIFQLAAAHQSFPIALEAKTVAHFPEANATAAHAIAQASREFYLAHGALSVDLRMLDMLFAHGDERLKGLKRHVGDWLRTHGPDDKWFPTVETASGTCGVVIDTARMLGLMVRDPSA